MSQRWRTMACAGTLSLLGVLPAGAQGGPSVATDLALNPLTVPRDRSGLADPSVLAVPASHVMPGDVMATAVEAFTRGDLARSRDLATRALAEGTYTGPRQAQVYKLLAFSEYLLGDADRFEVHIRDALAITPHDADLHYHLGRHLFEERRYREAASAFGRTRALDPDHYKARYYDGLLAEATGQPDQAKRLFLEAIATVERLRVRYVWPHVDLGRLLVEHGELDRGLSWLYRAVRTDPELPYGHYEYAKALLKQQTPTADIEQALREAIRLDPGYASAYYVLARYYAKTGDDRQAHEMFARFRDVRARDVPSPYGLRR